ncbi:pol-like protein ENS-3 [Grus japonensis]|uniref:ribonuclease H n=1 Tax=Grus japonensis TaxID=30415 RepID=A0ABC9YES8_GRUJA
MSVITKETAECLNVKPGHRKVKFTGIDGIVKECPTAKIALWLPGERKLTRTEVLVGAANTNILGFDVLHGRVWKLPDGSVWSFAGRGDGEIAWLEEDETKAINLLEMSIPLPPSRITNVKQYPLPAAAHSGIDGVVTDLEKRGIITRTHSPYNSPVWPVKKLNGQWRLTIDYRRLNANTAPLTAAVPNIAELVTQIQGASHPCMATLDVKDMFFMIPLQEHDKAQFAFTWKGIQYTFNRLPQGYKHSPTIAHNALAKVLSEIPSPQGITIYQYIDDILIGGENSEEVGHTMEGIQEKLITLGLDIPPSKCQGPAQEVKFLGVWWIKGAASIPPNTLEKIEHGQNPSSVKDLQQVLGTLGYWCKHIPGFSIIARPLYNLLRKGKSWEWTKQHETALELLIRELRLFQQLGPLHPTDPIHVEWGFSEHGSHCNLWQKGPEGPERPLEFSSHSFNDTEMRYSDLEKGLLSLVQAVKKVEQIRKGQSVIIRRPFRLLDIVRKGTAPPAGIAQKPTVRKWYAYLESINDIMPIMKGSIKVSKLQKDIDSTLLFQTPPGKPSPIQEAPPLKEGSDLKGVWFTDASSYRQNNEWNYKAVALEVATGEKLSETGKGSAQVGELRAVLLATRHGASHIYTDSYAVFKGATEWAGHWAVNDWQVNRVPVWQTDSWKQLLEIGEQRLLHIGWVKGYDRSASIAAQFNQQVDSLTRLQKIDVVSNEHEWERLLEWLHIKRGRTGRADLYREGIARGWPISVKLCEQVVTACSQCRLRLNKDHPSKAPPLHIRDKKTLWHTWQIDYIGPLRPSGGKKYILVGVEVISGITMATAVTAATGENTVHSLKEWFSTLPLPEEIQSDNGSHFSATVVQDWVKEEGIRWVFHTPYYPRANGIVERTNGLVKRFAKTHESGWHLRLSSAIYQLNNRWSGDGCPKMKAFCASATTLVPKADVKPGEYPTGFYAGQPVLVKMPHIGPVAMVLTTPKNLYAWEAKDSSGKLHRISTRWIVPTF